MECQTEELIFIDETPESITVSQRRLLHETNNLHPFQQDRAREEKYYSKAEEEKSDNRFSKGMPLRSDLSVVKVYVSWVQGASKFEGFITKLEFLQIACSINSSIFLEGNPHIIWRVYLLKIFFLDLNHIILNISKLVKFTGFEGCCSLFQLVCHFLVIEAEVNVDDITIFHRYTLLSNELLFDRSDHL